MLLAASMVAIVYPLLEGRQLGWPGWVWPVLAAGAPGVAALALAEEKRSGHAARTAPLLRARLLRVPAFAAGLGVQTAFTAGLQGFFLVFALWLQIGEHFSPLKAGLTAVAFSAGSFILAPVAVPLAQKYGRRVLVIGAVADGRRHRAGDRVHRSGRDQTGARGRSCPGLVVAGAGLPAAGDPAGERRAGGGAGRGRAAARPGCSARASSSAGRSAWRCSGPFFGSLGSAHTFAAALGTPRHTRSGRSCSAAC